MRSSRSFRGSIEIGSALTETLRRNTAKKSPSDSIICVGNIIWDQDRNGVSHWHGAHLRWNSRFNGKGDMAHTKPQRKVADNRVVTNNRIATSKLMATNKRLATHKPVSTLRLVAPIGRSMAEPATKPPRGMKLKTVSMLTMLFALLC